MAHRRRSATPRPAAPAAGSEERSFEAAMERLEGIVDRLEGGDLELEAALGAFEEGVALTRGCLAKLDEAERRVEVLVREGAEAGVRPFEEQEPEETD